MAGPHPNRRPYRELFSVPHMRTLAVAAFIGRIPVFMGSLGIILFIAAQYGSFASAGIIAGLNAGANALCGPQHGRFIDRFGPYPVLTVATIISSAGFCGIAILGLADAPLVVVGASSIVAGAATPRVGASLRGIFSTLLNDYPSRLRSATSLNAILEEMSAILGPALAAVIASTISPAAILFVTPALLVIGIALFVMVPAVRKEPGKQKNRLGSFGMLKSQGMQTLLLCALPIGLCFGGDEIFLSALAAERGASNMAGFMIAAFSVGGIAGGLLYGSRTHINNRSTVYRKMLWLIPITQMLLIVSSSPIVVSIMAFFAGMPAAAIISAKSELLEDVAPGNSMAEAYSWLGMAVFLGTAAGSVLAGVLVEPWGWKIGVVVFAVTGVLGASLALVRKTTIQKVQNLDPI